MASLSEAPNPTIPEFTGLNLTSHQTALAIIFPPSAPQSNTISALRGLYDRAYQTWLPHINLIYPFVKHPDLQSTVSIIREALSSNEELFGKIPMELDGAAFFKHNKYATVYLSPSEECTAKVTALRAKLVEALTGHKVPVEDNFIPHLTIGQTSLKVEQMRPVLDKCERLVANEAIRWHCARLVVLHRSADANSDIRKMRILDEILLDGSSVGAGPPEDDEKDESGERDRIQKLALEGQLSPLSDQKFSHFPTYQFSAATGTYVPYKPSPTAISSVKSVSHLVVSTYNTLVDSPFPPPVERYPKLLSSILGTTTSAGTHASNTGHVLCLQEITDDFLSYLLSQDSIRAMFPYTTHSSSHGVLPSLRNCVTLANIPLGSIQQNGNAYWEWVDLGKRHKGAVVVEVGYSCRIATEEEKEKKKSRKAIIANVHLTCGISNGSIAAKASQIKALTGYFESRANELEEEAWIVAGDFNIPSSISTITSAYSSKSISQDTYTLLMKGVIPSEKWTDTYIQSHFDSELSPEDLQFDGTECPGSSAGTLFHTDDHMLGEGEFGATFNPLTNLLAAERVKWGANPRPQRYDRVLLYNSVNKFLEIRRTGRFGLEGGSDHWGTWSHFRLTRQDNNDKQLREKKILTLATDSGSVIENEDIETWIKANGMVPTAADYKLREEAKELLRKVLLGEIRRKKAQVNTASETLGESSDVPIAKNSIRMVLQDVGSYYMNVFSPASDLDMLCASNISAKTFWALARQRLRRHGKSAGIRILRTVDAHSGVMMELEYTRTRGNGMAEAREGLGQLDLEEGGQELAANITQLVGDEKEDYATEDMVCAERVRIDLQYCQVPEQILESWTQLPLLPASDPIFSLPVTTLKKLNAYRDASYLLLTIPNLKLFRLTYRALKLWAIRRGIHSARFGYLGGIHLVLLLSRIFKLIDPTKIMDMTAGQVLKLFFEDYEGFKYEEEDVSDPDFGSSHGGKKYQRSGFREPFAITTMHAPMVNVAHGASKHTLKTLRDEILLANEKLGRNCGWDAVTGRGDGEAEREFLNGFGNFVKIDLQYWGKNIPRGRSLVGWIESRCVTLLVELNSKLPHMHARMWPGRFINTNEEQSKEELRGFYLVGLSSSTTFPTLASPSLHTPEDIKELNEQKKQAYNKFTGILCGFEQHLRDEEKNYDVTESYISVSRVSRQSMGEHIRSDTHIWWDQEFEEGSEGTTNSGDGNSDGDGMDWDSEDSEDVVTTEEGGHVIGIVGGDNISKSTIGDINESNSQQVPLDASSLGPDSKNNGSTTTKTTAPKTPQQQPLPSTYLRPASDVMNRIKWDPEFDIRDYVIGYEDRFLGVKETEMSRWRKEQTDEEFIPEHRVVYFRRKSDGVKVWDRMGKRDLVFGTGV